MIGFGVRNLKVFFKDKASVFFSLLAVFIIIGLYALFLGDVWVNSLGNAPGAEFLMNSWIMAGLLAVTSVTTTMGAFGTMVDDKSKKIIKDFTVSPIKNGKIVGGYIFSSIIIGIIMSLVTVVLAEVYIIVSGGEFMGFEALLKVLGLVVLATTTNASMVLLLVSFFKSINAFATASTVIGTLIGFLTGIYLPIGQLPEGVQWVVKCFPPSHAALLFRQVMMEAPMAATFEGAPAETIDSFEQLMGATFKFGETTVSVATSILILIGSAVVFYGLALWNISRKKR
ncbi:MAG TPA: ABC transporter permease [Oscillospiraceae bacterium]|nr:ABC transporter permease [Oscillospiraceae bacterium]HPF57015.1 ABC transporter permease [Clostridiales bacterium]HPK35776.1 ABC transporter permease [Oscillospiraceae bacterium]HPR75396.1 ABC transporter permease [Oscillospiraceae bacterium]